MQERRADGRVAVALSSDFLGEWGRGRFEDSRKPGRSCVSSPSQPQDTGEGEPVPLSSGREPPFPPSPGSPGASKMGMGSWALLWGKESNFRTCAAGGVGGEGGEQGLWGRGSPLPPQGSLVPVQKSGQARLVAEIGWGQRQGRRGAGPAGGTGASGSSLWMMDSQARLTSW